MARSITDKLQVALLLPGLLAVLMAGPVMAQSQQKGDGSLRAEYQYIRTGSFYDKTNEYNYWNNDSHIGLLSGSYTFTDRWTVYASIPYVQKRFKAVPNDPYNGDPHNPNDPWWIDFVPPDKRFIDDEKYHGGFQDLSFGFMYLALDGPLTLSPYIGYGYPSTNYPFYAKAAIGQNLWTVPVGVAFTFIPYFSDWYLDGNISYVFSEKPLDINVNYWVGNLSTGYFFTPRFSMNIFLSGKYVTNGRTLEYFFTDPYINYPEDHDTIEWWQHDRILAHRFFNAGIGFDYFIGENYQLSGSYFRSVWAEQTNEVDKAFTLAFSYYWGEN